MRVLSAELTSAQLEAIRNSSYYHDRCFNGWALVNPTTFEKIMCIRQFRMAHNPLFTEDYELSWDDFKSIFQTSQKHHKINSSVK